MKKYISKAITLLEHHKEHHIDVKIFGETRHLCARCTGEYLIGIPVFILCSILYLQGYLFDFKTIFILSWVFAGATIIDWSSVELLKIRKGNNTTRLITGGTLSIGVTMYLWLLPATWTFKLSTLLIYCSIMFVITFISNCKKHEINPLTEISKTIDNAYYMLTHPKVLFATCTCCPCCGTACCCGTSTCLPCLCCCCSCGLLLTICSLFSGKSCGSCGSCSSCGSCGNQKKQ